MKSVAFFAFVLSFSASAAPVAWQNLEAGAPVLLTQSLKLDAKPNGSISIRSGAPYVLDSISPLDGLSVVDYVFVSRECRFPNLEGELTMILPAGSGSGSEVGVYSLKGCALEVMVETKDLAQPSFFGAR